MPGVHRVHIKNINANPIEFEMELEKICSREEWIFKGQTYTIEIDESLDHKIDELRDNLAKKGNTIIITKGGL